MHGQSSGPPHPPAALRAWQGITSGLNNMAVQDWTCIAFHFYFLVRATFAPSSANASYAGRFALLLFTMTVTTVVLVRCEILRPGRFRALFYRVGLFTPILLSYVELRRLLPALAPHLVDAQLHSIDQTLFVLTPAAWFERFNSPPFVEWFAFFYFSYFVILTVMILPTLFLDHGRRRHELLLGAMTVACVGHVGYTLVPGVGPHAWMDFTAPIQGGFWWGLVQETVHDGGAMMDIFPSLHTAYPTFFALHAYGHRRRAPFKQAWPVLAFFAVNIIIATMFLRWHYGIDVIAGLLLALTARIVSVRVAAREHMRGRDGTRQPVWEPLFGTEG